MRLKHGVRLLGVKPEMVVALLVADTMYKKAGSEMWVTSLVDGKHSRTSRHYLGYAGDLRTRNLRNIHKMLRDLQEALPEFVIIFENEGTPNQHFHMQFNGGATKAHI